MANWDEDSTRLRKNLTEVLRGIRETVRQRLQPQLDDARAWQKMTMRGLNVPDPTFVGAFRGEPGVEFDVYVGSADGVASGDVAAELARFEQVVQAAVAELDARFH